MSKKLNIKERVAELLEDYCKVVAWAERAEDEVKRLTFVLEETQASLEAVVNDVDYAQYLKDYNAALTRAEKAEDEVADLKQQLADAQKLNGLDIVSLRALALMNGASQSKLKTMVYHKCPACGWYACVIDPKTRKAYCQRCSWKEPNIATEVEKLRKEVDRLQATVIYAESNLNQYKKAYRLLADYHNSDRNSWKLELSRRDKRIAELEKLND